MLRWWRGGVEMEIREIFRGPWGYVVIRRSMRLRCLKMAINDLFDYFKDDD